MIAWISPTLLTTSASGSIVWTVDNPGDILAFKYTILGKTMMVIFHLATTSVSGAGDTLKITIPAAKVASKEFIANYEYIDSGAWSAGRATVAAGGSTINLTKRSVSNWTAAVNTTSVRGRIVFETQ